MKYPSLKMKRAFTLLETVIAIGVLAVLLTTFMTVFGPASQGIRRAINVQEADRLASSLENEMSTLRPDEKTASIKSGFDKAFNWITQANQDDNLIYVYQYRGDPAQIRPDNSYQPYTDVKGVAGRDFIVQGIARRRSDPLVVEDLEALEGRLFVVKLTQLVPDNNGALAPGTAGQVVNPKGGAAVTLPDDFEEGAIAFVAEFFTPTTVASNYIRAGGALTADKLKDPLFVRNIAVRR